MSIDHNRIKIADLEKNLPNKIVTTDQNGQLEFSNISDIKIDSYNALDYTVEGKALDARQGKVLKDLIDNINTLLATDNVNLNSLQELVDAIEVVQNSLTTILVNDLTSGGTTKALTAEMGKVLQNNKVDKVGGKNLLSDSEIARLGTLSNYTHPANHPPSIITQDPGNRFVSDIEKAAWNAKQTSLGFVPENSSNKNIASGYAGLGVDGKLISSQLPSITVNDTFVIASQAAMLALSVEKGDIAVRTDLNKSFILKGSNPALLGDWQELLTPTSAVTTVFGRNGAITSQTGDYNTDQINETATRKFQSANQQAFNDATSSIQTQLNGKQTAGNYEPAITKNTAFNKNFGTTTGTIAEGSDARIINGQTSFGWGNHAGLYKSVGYVPSWGEISSKPTTLSGFGITDALSLSGTHYIGTTNLAFNRTSAAQTLTGVSIDGNANTIGGLAVHSSTNSEPNKIVRTDSNGYIQAGWINTVSGDSGANAINRIYASGDQYLRYYTPANFISTLGLATTVTSIQSNLSSGTPVASYFTSNGTVSGIKVKLPFATNSGKMVSFTVRLYQNYEAYDVQFSGYLYESINNWYSPKAVMICGTNSINAIMGRDSDGKAYVWLSGGSYSGAAVFDVVGGYNTADWNTGWTITNDASVPSQVLNTNVYPTLNINSYKNYSAFSGIVSSGNGFQTANYAIGARNRIWSFGDADGYGMSYFQGSAGQYGTDSIGIHFGTSTNAASQFIFANNGDLITTGLTTSSALGVNQTTGSGQGISLYAGAVNGMPSYGLTFATTSNFGGFGSVSGDWATYFTMAGATNRGWIFRSTNTNIASISATGVFTGSNFVGPLSGNADSSTSARRISFGDGPRTLSDRLPNSFARTVNFDFVNASIVGGSGNYGGVMTFAPWDGLSNSTGDSSYQLAFRNESGINGSGLPGLRLRKGIDTSWGGWYDMLHSGNYSSFSAFSGAITGASLTVSGDVVAFSDERVKENIRPIKDTVKRIQASRGIVYDRIDTKQKNNIGFIAQELEKTFPELVITQKDGTKAVKYQNAVAILFEAIKDQQTQIEEQQQINQEQNEKIKAILQHLNIKQ